MSEASKHQRYRAGALSACCNACDAPCCPSGTCASIAARSSKSTKNINPRSAMCPRPSLLHLGSALRLLWSSSCDPKARKCWPRLHPSSLFEMYWAQAPTPHINTAPAPTRLILLLDGRFAELRWLQFLFYGLGDRVLSGTFLIMSLHL